MPVYRRTIESTEIVPLADGETLEVGAQGVMNAISFICDSCGDATLRPQFGRHNRLLCPPCLVDAAMSVLGVEVPHDA
jgi:hypothetical protein